MGIAFLAESGDSWVVIKVLRPELSQNLDFRMRLRRELDSLQRLDPLQAVGVLAHDLDGNQPWFAMEYVEGQSLADRVRTVGPLQGNVLVDFARDLADQIAAIHSVGITHRDIKPTNIILSLRGPKIIDFGVALLDEKTALTASGIMVGTLAWASPEQVAGDRVGSATDVHAWGLSVLYAATGRSPFEADSIAGLLYKVVHTQPDIPPNLPAGLSARLSAATLKSPARRPSIVDLRAEAAVVGAAPLEATVVEEATEVLDEASDETEVLAELRPRSSTRPLRPPWIPFLAVGIAAVVVVAGVFVFLRPGDQLLPQDGDVGAPQFGISLAASADRVEVAETITLEAQLEPASRGVPVEAYVQLGTNREVIGSAMTNTLGIASFTVGAPPEAGVYLFSVEAQNSSGISVSSPSVEVEVLRMPTTLVEAAWPTRPQRWCSRVKVPVRIAPAQEGRLVSLEYRDNQGEWIRADSSRTRDDGTARVDVPECSEGAASQPEQLRWRVSVAESPSMESKTSPEERIRYCPAPRSLPFTLDAFAEFAPLEVVITNPNSDCAAYARIEAEFTCLADVVDATVPSLTIGRRVSDPPIFVGPGETRGLEFREVFTDSQERCREYFPGYVIWPDESTLKVFADYFEAP